jgi:hypothetical protein
MGEFLHRNSDTDGTPHVAELTDADLRFFHELPGGDKILGVVQFGDEGELRFETVVARFRRITEELEAKEEQKDE